MHNKTLSIVLLLISCFSLQSCFLNKDEDDDCTLTAFPITDGNLITGYDPDGNERWVPTTIYKTPKNMELYFSLGSCGVNELQSNWEYTGDFKIVNQVNTGPLTAIFYSSGTLCAQFTGNGTATAQACQPIKVLSNNVWTTGSDYPGDNAINTITLNLDNNIYSGFGTSNDWYMLDTLDFSWKEKAKISGPVQFTSFGGFSLNNKGYIVGNNSKVYEYDPNANTWTSIGDFPVNVAEYLQLTTIQPRNYFYSILATSAGGKGYFGLGEQNRLWEFDPVAKTWTEKATYPNTHEYANHIFSYNNRIYAGEHYYDIASDQWIKNNYDFKYENDFGAGFVEIDGLMYSSHKSKTITYDGTTVSFYEPRPHEPHEPFAPNNYSGQGAAIGNVVVYPRPNRYQGAFIVEENSTVLIYRK